MILNLTNSPLLWVFLYLGPYVALFGLFFSTWLAWNGSVPCSISNKIAPISKLGILIFAAITGLPPSPLFFLKLKLLILIKAKLGFAPAALVMLMLLSLWFAMGSALLRNPLPRPQHPDHTNHNGGLDRKETILGVFLFLFIFFLGFVIFIQDLVDIFII